MLLGLWIALTGSRAPRRGRDRVFGAGEALCRAGAGGDLAPVGPQDAASS